MFTEPQNAPYIYTTALGSQEDSTGPSYVKNVVVHFSPNERWNSSVLSARLNVNRDGSDWINGGRVLYCSTLWQRQVTRGHRNRLQRAFLWSIRSSLLFIIWIVIIRRIILLWTLETHSNLHKLYIAISSTACSIGWPQQHYKESTSICSI